MHAVGLIKLWEVVVWTSRGLKKDSWHARHVSTWDSGALVCPKKCPRAEPLIRKSGEQSPLEAYAINNSQRPKLVCLYSPEWMFCANFSFVEKSLQFTTRRSHHELRMSWCHNSRYFIPHITWCSDCVIIVYNCVSILLAVLVHNSFLKSFELIHTTASRLSRH